MAAPFLEILTRVYKRPRMLAVNQESVKALGTDVLHTLLIDEVGCGVEWAQENLANYNTSLQGRYIWILDDDDKCIRPDLVNELRAIVATWNPDVIMVKMDHHERGVLPSNGHWQKPPEHGFIGCSAYIVKREIWQGNAAAWFPGSYYSDFNFIKALFDGGVFVYWHDVEASEVQRISLGRSE